MRNGEFLVKKAVEELGSDIILMSDRYGKELSKVFLLCVAQLVEKMKN